jgi:hypothetical protein
MTSQNNLTAYRVTVEIYRTGKIDGTSEFYRVLFATLRT